MNLTYLINKLTEIRDQVGDLPAEVLYAGPITAICGWQTSTEDEKDPQAWNKMFREMEQALSAIGIEVLMCGPSSDFSMILRPKFVRLS